MGFAEDLREAEGLTASLSERLKAGVPSRIEFAVPLICGKIALARRLLTWIEDEAPTSLHWQLPPPHRKFFGILASARLHSYEPEYEGLLVEMAENNQIGNTFDPDHTISSSEISDHEHDRIDLFLQGIADREQKSVTYDEVTEVLRISTWLASRLYDCGEAENLAKFTYLFTRAVSIYCSCTPQEHRIR